MFVAVVKFIVIVVVLPVAGNSLCLFIYLFGLPSKAYLERSDSIYSSRRQFLVASKAPRYGGRSLLLLLLQSLAPNLTLCTYTHLSTHAVRQINNINNWK